MPTIVTAALLISGAFAARGARAYEARSECPVVASDEFFFPPSVFESSRPDLDQFRRAWYSKHLRTMGEPSLSCGPSPDSEVYRFIWLRTFHRPVAIRVARSNRSARLVAVELTGAGGYDPGHVARRVERPVSPAEWQGLVAALRKSDFWMMPTPPAGRDLGLDGAQWVIEGRRIDAYHVVDRWSPRGGPYRDAGLAFLQLAGLSATGKDVY